MFGSLAAAFALFISWHFWIEHAPIFDEDTRLFLAEIGTILIFIFGTMLLLFVGIFRGLKSRAMISEKRYTRVFNQVKDAIIVFRADTFQIVDVNHSAIELYQYPLEEFKKLSILDISAEVEKTIDSISKVRNGVQHKLNRRFHRRRDGSKFVAEISGTKFLDGGRDFIIGCVRNVTENVKNSEKLKAFKFSLDKAGDAVFWLTYEGQITYANDEACESLGFSHEELLRLSVYDISVDLSVKKWQAYWELIKTGAGNSVYEVAHRRKDGSIFPVEKTAKIIVDSNGEETISIFSRDISERKIAERALAQTAQDLEMTRKQQENYSKQLEDLVYELQTEKKRAEDATKAKSEFLANMSHELRTPLTAILGFTNILHRLVKNPKQLQAIDIIQRNGDYLLQLLDDVLDLSKVEAGKITTKIETIDLIKTINDIISLMRVRAKAKGLRILLSGENPVPRFISTDRLRLKQILINLVGNAIKFTEVGNVRIKISLVKENTGYFIRFQVIDTGIGMSSNQIDGLFVPFKQVDNSLTRKYSGTGLGLTISKRFAEILKGKLEVVSDLGVGSNFQFYCPIGIPPEAIEYVSVSSNPSSANEKVIPNVRASSKNAIENRETQLPLAGKSILLVEDGPDNQHLFSYFLENSGAQVTLANNGLEALEQVRLKADSGNRYDLILMDIQMPVLDGYEATKELRKKGIDSPIIALTAHVFPEESKKCFDVGCDDIVTKPTYEEPLIKKISQYTSVNFVHSEKNQNNDSLTVH